MTHHDTAARGLLPEASRRLIRSADALAVEQYAEPSLLPGWTRGHVLAHLALNAEGLGRALSGLVEGEAATMYRSDEARDSDIEGLAAEPPETIRARLLAATSLLAEAIDAVPEDLWDTQLERTPGGRSFPAAAVPDMRLREVEIHHADLAVGYGPDDWPAEFAELLVEALLERDPADQPLRLHATDLDRTWAVGDDGPTVSGTAPRLGWWLSGRGAGEGLTSDRGDLPKIEEY